MGKNTNSGKTMDIREKFIRYNKYAMHWVKVPLKSYQTNTKYIIILVK